MGLDCLLVSTNQVVTPYPVYPLGVAHLAGALVSSGHRVSFFDLLAHGSLARLKELLKKNPPDLVAVSVRNLDSLDSTAEATFLGETAEAVEIVKKNSDATVVMGGPAFSILPEECMKVLGPDYGIVGEGEILLPWLADQLERGEGPGERIFYATPSDAPWKPVLYHKKTADYYLKWGGMLNIQTKRGCPYKCVYCSYPYLEGRKLRFRDPAEVAEEVRRVTAELGARYIFFTDAVFNDPKEHYLEVAEALIRSGNKTPWCAFFRPQGLTKE